MFFKLNQRCVVFASIEQVYKLYWQLFQKWRTLVMIAWSPDPDIAWSDDVLPRAQEQVGAKSSSFEQLEPVLRRCKHKELVLSQP